MWVVLISALRDSLLGAFPIFTAPLPFLLRDAHIHRSGLHPCSLIRVGCCGSRRVVDGMYTYPAVACSATLYYFHGREERDAGRRAE